jgi:hypothetical protein
MNNANQPPSPLDDSSDPTELTLDWGMTSIPISDTPANFLVMGGIGSGKDISLRLLMQSALRNIGSVIDHRALIFDAKGNMESLLREMDLRCPVHLLNPFDRMGAAWDIAADITSPTAALKLAASLIPEDDLSAQPFFTDAARQLFAAACLSFTRWPPAGGLCATSCSAHKTVIAFTRSWPEDRTPPSRRNRSSAANATGQTCSRLSTPNCIP